MNGSRTVRDTICSLTVRSLFTGRESMKTTFRYTSWMRGFLLLGICLLALSIIPPSPAHAAVTKRLKVDNNLGEFATGVFQRTSLSALTAQQLSTKLSDEIGALQLGPIGTLKGWTNSPYHLPQQL